MELLQQKLHSSGGGNMDGVSVEEEEEEEDDELGVRPLDLENVLEVHVYAHVHCII